MRLRVAGSGLLLGAGTSVLALAILSLGYSLWDLPIAPFDVFEWIVRHLPGALVTRGIDTMVAAITTLGIGPIGVAAKLLEQSMAIVLFVVGSAILGALVAVVIGQAETPSLRRTLAAGLVAGAVWSIVAVAARAALGRVSLGSIIWLGVVLLGWGALVAVLLQRRLAAAHTANPAAARRHFLVAAVGGIVAGSAVLLGISGLVGRRARRGARRASDRVTLDDVAKTSGPAASPSRDVLAARIAPAPGTRPELTSNADFYRIDINLMPPRLAAEDWRLELDGLVDRPQSLTLEDLEQLPAVTQAITLECISNPVGGDLIGTSLWTGVPLRLVLERAGIRPSARAVHVRAADGFYESVSYDDMTDPRTLLVYAMNHQPLPDLHGFPLRIYIPNHHGMKQPKWITRLTASDHDGPGYWVDRGWSATAVPHTTSVIDTVAAPTGELRVVQVGGIAYAGARGISRVEVQVDGGPWTDAKLIAPALGPLCWVLWRYDWPHTPGRHTFRVRAYDGTGALQDVEQRPPHPDGATGVHALTTTL